MNWALLIKELRALRPVLWCIWGLGLLACIYLVATELPDAQPFKPEVWIAESSDGTFGMLLIFCLIIGAGLLVHESEAGTLRFLDGLPLSRTRLFAAKTSAALLVIASIPLFGFITDVAFGLFSRTSLDGPLPWHFAGVVAFLQMVVGLYLLALAMLVSFVRSWFALVAGLLFWGFLWLRQTGVDWLSYVDPHDLLEPDMVDGVAQIPWPQIGAHLGAAGLFLILAWIGFRHLGDDAQRLSDRIERNRFLRGFGTLLKLLAPLVWLGAVIQLAGSQGASDDAEAKTPVGEESFARTETKRYEFLMRSVQWEDAQPLIREADRVHDQVAAFLGVPATPTRLVVDLASPVISHAAGQTNWTKIRLPLSSDQDLAEQRRILGHETTHVFIEQLGGGRLSSHFGSIRCLHEGLATHVEKTLFGTAEDQARDQRAVAGAWSRGKVPFTLLVDNETLGRQRDPTLVYPLGAELARALVAIHGREASARLLRAIGRPGAPLGLSGAALWRDAMQAAGLDFERLTGVYESACADIATKEKDFVATLPRLSAEATIEGDVIVVRPKFEGSSPGQVVCAVESDEPFGVGFDILQRRDDGAFTLLRSRHLKPSLRYLLGWRTPETEMPVFEPWAEATLK